MEAMRKKKMIWIILVITLFYAIFLVIFYPIFQKLPLPFGITRWHDLLAAPVWTLAIILFLTNEDLEKEYDVKYSSAWGIIMGIIVGLVIGLFNVSLLWPVGNILLTSAIILSSVAVLFFLLNLITDSTLESSFWSMGMGGGFCLAFGITACGLVLGLAAFIAIVVFNVCLAVIYKLIKHLINYFNPKNRTNSELKKKKWEKPKIKDLGTRVITDSF